MYTHLHWESLKRKPKCYKQGWGAEHNEMTSDIKEKGMGNIDRHYQEIYKQYMCIYIPKDWEEGNHYQKRQCTAIQ